MRAIKTKGGFFSGYSVTNPRTLVIGIIVVTAMYFCLSLVLLSAMMSGDVIPHNLPEIFKMVHSKKNGTVMRAVEYLLHPADPPIATINFQQGNIAGIPPAIQRRNTTVLTRASVGSWSHTISSHPLNPKPDMNSSSAENLSLSSQALNFHNIRTESPIELLKQSAFEFNYRKYRKQTKRSANSMSNWFPVNGISTIEASSLQSSPELWISPGCLLLAPSNLRMYLCDEHDGRWERRALFPQHPSDSATDNESIIKRLQHLSSLQELLLSVYLFHFGIDEMFNFGSVARLRVEHVPKGSRRKKRSYADFGFSNIDSSLLKRSSMSAVSAVDAEFPTLETATNSHTSRFHLDLEEYFLANSSPDLSTVTYLNDDGPPTVVFDALASDAAISSDSAEANGQVPTSAFISFPRHGKHISFPGNLLVGHIDELGLPSQQKRAPLRDQLYRRHHRQNVTNNVPGQVPIQSAEHGDTNHDWSIDSNNSSYHYNITTNSSSSRDSSLAVQMVALRPKVTQDELSQPTSDMRTYAVNNTVIALSSNNNDSIAIAIATPATTITGSVHATNTSDQLKSISSSNASTSVDTSSSLRGSNRERRLTETHHLRGYMSPTDKNAADSKSATPVSASTAPLSRSSDSFVSESDPITNLSLNEDERDLMSESLFQMLSPMSSDLSAAYSAAQSTHANGRTAAAAYPGRWEIHIDLWKGRAPTTRVLQRIFAADSIDVSKLDMRSAVKNAVAFLHRKNPLFVGKICEGISSSSSGSKPDIDHGTEHAISLCAQIFSSHHGKASSSSPVASHTHTGAADSLKYTAGSANENANNNRNSNGLLSILLGPSGADDVTDLLLPPSDREQRAALRSNQQMLNKGQIEDQDQDQGQDQGQGEGTHLHNINNSSVLLDRKLRRASMRERGNLRHRNSTSATSAFPVIDDDLPDVDDILFDDVIVRGIKELLSIDGGFEAPMASARIVTEDQVTTINVPSLPTGSYATTSNNMGDCYTGKLFKPVSYQFQGWTRDLPNVLVQQIAFKAYQLQQLTKFDEIARHSFHRLARLTGKYDLIEQDINPNKSSKSRAIIDSSLTLLAGMDYSYYYGKLSSLLENVSFLNRFDKKELFHFHTQLFGQLYYQSHSQFGSIGFNSSLVLSSIQSKPLQVVSGIKTGIGKLLYYVLGSQWHADGSIDIPTRIGDHTLDPKLMVPTTGITPSVSITNAVDTLMTVNESLTEAQMTSAPSSSLPLPAHVVVYEQDCESVVPEILNQLADVSDSIYIKFGR